MRVRYKSVDGLRKGSRRPRVVLSLVDGLRWYWQRAKWRMENLWLDWKSGRVQWEEKSLDGWQRWWSGIVQTHDDFVLLCGRVGEVFWDRSLNLSTKIKSLLNGFKTSVLNPHGRFRTVAGFLLMIFITSIISAGLISYISIGWGLSEGFVQAAENGVTEVKSGIKALKEQDFDQAAFNFAQADRNFSEIKRNLNNFGQGDVFLEGTLAGDEYDNVINLIDGLQATARGAKFMTAAVGVIEEYSGQNLTQVFFGIIGNDDQDIFVMIDQAGEYIEKSNSEIQKAVMYFQSIDQNRIPADYKEIYQQSILEADRYLNILRGINAIFVNADNLLGRHYPASYLLLFQNNNELRPTGGFIGSYGVVTFSDGKMTDLKFDDVYNPDGQMLEKIEPPYPVNLMTDQWGIRDSNWDPDFVYSARRAALFYEKSGGATVDGIMAFTPDIIQHFLVLTGPVELPDYEVVLTSENFQEEIQREIEVDAGQTAQPKQILGELLPLLMDRLANLSPENKSQLWQVWLDLLYEKHILIYLNDQEIENLLGEIGWTGEMVQVGSAEDFLCLVHANIGGRKSDGFITETVNHRVEIGSQGEIVVELEIIKKNGDDWSKFNHANFDYLRVYVPLGSQLEAVDGFVNPAGIYNDEAGAIWYDAKSGESTLASTSAYEEYGKTVFANWIVTDPWGVSVVKYRYRLPFKVGDWFADQGRYDIYVQKQSGRRSLDYNFFLRANDWEMFDGQGNDIGQDWEKSDQLLTDWETDFVLKKSW